MFANELDDELSDLVISGVDFEFHLDYFSIPNNFENNFDFILNIKENDSKIAPFFRLGTDYSKMFLFGSGLAYDFRKFFPRYFMRSGSHLFLILRILNILVILSLAII